MCIFILEHALHEKAFQKKGVIPLVAARKNECFSSRNKTADEPVMSPFLTVGFVFPSVYISICLFVLLRNLFSDVSSMLLRV